MNVPIARDSTASSAWWRALALVPLALALALLSLPFFDEPRYDLRGGTLTARSAFSGVEVPFHAARDLRVALLRQPRRVGLGSSPRGACVGEYLTANFGRLTLLGDCNSPAVVFVHQGRRVAVTPDDPEAFIQAWRDGLTLRYGPAVARRFTLADALFAAPFGLIGLAALFLLRRVRRLGYALDHAGLQVTTAFGQLLIPYGRISRVWRPAGRLGWPLFALRLPHYHVGRFTWAGGALDAVDAAASCAQGGVIVELGDRALYLTPADPTAFVTELDRRRLRTTTMLGRFA